MKYIFLLGLVSVLVSTCDRPSKPSPKKLAKVKTAKTLIKNYDHKTYERGLHTDSSEITNNTKDDEIKKDKAAVNMLRYYYDMSNMMTNTGLTFNTSSKK